MSKISTINPLWVNCWGKCGIVDNDIQRLIVYRFSTPSRFLEFMELYNATNNIKDIYYWLYRKKISFPVKVYTLALTGMTMTQIKLKTLKGR